MHTKKILNATIDLKPNELYTADLDNLLILKSTERFVGKCFQAMLITKIERIIMRSCIMLYHNMINGGGYIDIKIEVAGIVLTEGEIIHGCSIINIQQSHITASSDNAIVRIQNNNSKITSILKIGMTIPIIVNKFGYIPGRKEIGIIGMPFTPQRSDHIFYIIDRGFNEDDEKKLNGLINLIKEEEKLHDSINKDRRYKFFQDIMSMWRTPQKYEQSAIASKLKLEPISLESKELAEIRSGICIAPPEDSPINKRIFYSKLTAIPNDISNNDNFIIVSGSLMAIVNNTYIKYLLYMQCLRGFMTTYASENAVESMLPYWQICKMMQI